MHSPPLSEGAKGNRYAMKRLLPLLCLLLFASLAFGEEKRYAVPIDNSPAFGPADAPVTIFEFLDYQ